MKLRILLSLLVFTAVGVACGKTRTVYIEQSIDEVKSTGCVDSAIEPCEKYPCGGVVITCSGAESAVIEEKCDKHGKKHK